MFSCRSTTTHHNLHGGGNTYELERALDEDLLLTSVEWANSYYANDSYGPDRDSYTDKWGVVWRNSTYTTRFGEGYYTEIEKNPLTEDSAIQEYRPPDPERPELYAESEWALRAAERLVRLGVDMIWIGDDVGAQNAMLMSPQTWRRFLKPRMAGFISAIKSINPSLKVACHSGGCISGAWIPRS